MVSNVVSSHYQSLRAPVRQAGGHLFEPSTAHTRAPAPSLAQARAGQYPDGLAYDPVERHVFVSDESGGVETVLNAAGEPSMRHNQVPMKQRHAIHKRGRDDCRDRGAGVRSRVAVV